MNETDKQATPFRVSNWRPSRIIKGTIDGVDKDGNKYVLVAADLLDDPAFCQLLTDEAKKKQQTLEEGE